MTEAGCPEVSGHEAKRATGNFLANKPGQGVRGGRKCVGGIVPRVVGGAGALACIIPAADLILSTSMLFTRNIICRTFARDIDSASQAKVAKIVVLAITTIALALAIYAPNMLVNLLLTGYSGVTQFFPMIVLGLFWKKATRDRRV